MTPDTAQQQDQASDMTAGKGQTRSEGDTIAPAATDQPSAADAPGQADAESAAFLSSGLQEDDLASDSAGEVDAGEGGGGDEEGTDGDDLGGGGGGEGSDGDDVGGSGNGGGDDPQPEPMLVQITESIALAETMRPIETATIDLYSPAPDRVKARAAILEAYRKAREPDGPLTVKFRKAAEKFDRTARDMGDRLDKWLAGTVRSGPIGMVLAERNQVARRFAARSGPREQARATAQARVKWWADRHADWSSPTDKMTAMIGQYVDKLDKLNADINNDVNADAAMATFWFDVAPKHLQLADKLDAKVAEAVRKVRDALRSSPDISDKLVLGRERRDGSLYLIAPDQLKQKREQVLGAWKDAAQDQAVTEADYKLRQDDAASLKQRWDKLKDDAWLKDALALLEKPAS